jgi:hypothetical protein
VPPLPSGPSQKLPPRGRCGVVGRPARQNGACAPVRKPGLNPKGETATGDDPGLEPSDDGALPPVNRERKAAIRSPVLDGGGTGPCPGPQHQSQERKGDGHGAMPWPEGQNTQREKKEGRLGGKSGQGQRDTTPVGQCDEGDRGKPANQGGGASSAGDSGSGARNRSCCERSAAALASSCASASS